MQIEQMSATFGRLNGSQLDLQPGLNVICAPNESGKSTWCRFLQNMLYGVPTKERGLLADKNRYAPWSGSPMHGRLLLRNGDARYTLLRETRRTTAPMGDAHLTYTGTADPVPGIPAAEALVSRAGENMRMLDNELKKLASMIDGPEITLADVERHVMRTAEVKPWELLNAVAARDLTRSLELLKLQPAKSEVRIWSLLVTRLRELIIAKSLDARGQAGQLASALGVQTWQVKNHASWARRWKMDELLEALSSAVDVELALKGSRDGELALQMWVMGMCRPQQRRGR